MKRLIGKVVFYVSNRLCEMWNTLGRYRIVSEKTMWRHMHKLSEVMEYSMITMIGVKAYGGMIVE